MRFLCSVSPLLLVSALVVIIVGIGPLLGGKKSPEKAKIKPLVKVKNVAEILWVCQQECIHDANEVVEDSDSSFPKKYASNMNDIFGKLLAEAEVKKIQSFLRSTVVDSSLLDCRRKKNIVFLQSGDDNVPNVIYARPYVRRDLIQSVGTSPAQSPAGIAPTPVPASSTPRFPRSTNRANPPLPPFTLGDFSDSTWQSTSGDKYASDVQSNNENNTYRTVAIAVIITASATFTVSALLFLGYCKLCSSSGKGRNDERPLLSLSLSDLSAASSRKSFTLNSSRVRENHSNDPLFDTNSSYNAKTGDFCLQSHSHSLDDWKTNDPVGTAAGADLKSADNLTVTKLDTCGLPPLKPPPGRRSSLIPTLNPGMTAPSLSLPLPPPPPPVPLPLKSSFGGCPPALGPPPIPFGSKPNPPPPPPPPIGVVSVTPPKPLLAGLKPPHSSSPIGSSNSSTSTRIEGNEADAPKAKLKPFFWDKVLANPNHSMVWHQIKSGSFQFNEEMIETLFGNALAEKNQSQQKGSSSQDPSSNYVQIIDTKKSQNLSILLKAQNVTAEEVRDALQEGYELPSELIQSLLKIAPTTDEELKLRLYSGDLSRLGPVERFLKVFVDIPFAFRRLELLLFMCTLQEEETLVKESLSILEAACMELRNSRLFLKLLEAVLKTGNRMNDGTYRGGAQAFKLDTLLKLSDVKGLGGKTTLLHFVVQEIIRSEGVRAARENRSMSSIDSDDMLEDTSYDTEDYYGSIGLQVVSGLGNELENVKQAAVLDADILTGTVSKLGESLIKARDFLNSEMKDVDEENGFYQTLRSFVQNTEVDIRWLLEEEKRIMALVKSTGNYFHGSSAKDEGLRLFVIVKDFLIILERVCRGLRTTTRNPTRPLKKEDTKTLHPETQQSPSPDIRQRIFPAIKNMWLDDSSSDDERTL